MDADPGSSDRRYRIPIRMHTRVSRRPVVHLVEMSDNDMDSERQDDAHSPAERPAS